MRKHLRILLIAAILGSAGAFYYYREKPDQPKRVWIEYVEKYRSGDYEQEWLENRRHAEAEFARQISESPGCIIVTGEKSRADYVVSLSVTRHDGDIFGEAHLSIAARNGDVLISEKFYQTRSSHEDIARMPLRKAWETLCPGKVWR